MQFRGANTLAVPYTGWATRGGLHPATTVSAESHLDHSGGLDVHTSVIPGVVRRVTDPRRLDRVDRVGRVILPEVSQCSCAKARASSIARRSK